MSLDEPISNGEKRNPDGTFAPGHIGGPGRPKGSISIKDLVRKHLENNPEDLSDFVTHFIKKNRELAWQMIEGRPQQDVTSDGKALPTPILNVLRNNNGNEEGGEPEQEN